MISPVNRLEFTCLHEPLEATNWARHFKLRAASLWCTFASFSGVTCEGGAEEWSRRSVGSRSLRSGGAVSRVEHY